MRLSASEDSVYFILRLAGGEGWRRADPSAEAHAVAQPVERAGELQPSRAAGWGLVGSGYGFRHGEGWRRRLIGTEFAGADGDGFKLGADAERFGISKELVAAQALAGQGDVAHGGHIQKVG